MSHTFTRQPWRKQRLFRQGRQLLVKPLNSTPAEPVVVDCCGGRCGEEDEPSELLKLLWTLFCPTPHDLVAVYYGGYYDDPDRRTPDQWVREHIQHCAHCGWEWRAIIRGDDDGDLLGGEEIIL